MTLPTQQPTQQELAAIRAAAEAVIANDSPRNMNRFDRLVSPATALAMLALIDAQPKKIAEQDAQLQAAYP